MKRKNNMQEIKQFDILSLGKIIGILYVIIGFIIGIIYSIISLITILIGTTNIIFYFGLGSVIFMPIFYGVIGFISGILLGVFYNMISSRIGGIKLELK